MATSSLLPKVEDIIVYNGDSPTSAILFWNVPELPNPSIVISGYRIQRKKTTDTIWTTLGDITTNKFEDTSLEFGNSYEWKVAVLYPEGTIALL